MSARPVCAVCKAVIFTNRDDAWCGGCRTFICEECDQLIPPTIHKPVEHTQRRDDNDTIDWDFALE
jgi:hypothetical protein